MLDEDTYKDLMRDVTQNNLPGALVHNLPHRDWAPLLRSVQFVEEQEGMLKFFVRNRYNGWFTYVKFVDWMPMVVDTSVTAPEAARLLLWAGNIQLHCPCPSYKYWGYNYILTRKDAAILPENRFPKIRNPELKGVACKHLRRTLKVLPFHLGTMAKEMKVDRDAETPKDAE